MTPEAAAELFTPFASGKTGGTGLGLAIARNAIIMHRGAIKVHSMEGEGTTFTVRIPLTYIS